MALVLAGCQTGKRPTLTTGTHSGGTALAAPGATAVDDQAATRPSAANPPVTSAATTPSADTIEPGGSAAPDGSTAGTGGKRQTDLAAELTIRGAYRLRAVSQPLIDQFVTMLDATDALSSSTGTYGAVEIVDSTTSVAFGRVFGYRYDTALADGSVDELVDRLTSAEGVSDVRATTVAQMRGTQFVQGGMQLFITGTDTDGVFVAVASNGLLLGATVKDFFEAAAT